MTTPAQDLKAQGQQDSLLGLLDDGERFLGIVAAYEPGTTLSVNDLRGQLDAAGIPDSARGGLFAKAVKAGLLVKETILHAGRDIAVTVPSTGLSAHAATVQVYRRPWLAPEGGVR